MADNELMAALRQALDDAVLTHTGRSIGDLASERVLADIMPEIEALGSDLMAQIAMMRPVVEAVAKWGIGGGMPVEFYEQARAFLVTGQAAESGDA